MHFNEISGAVVDSAMKVHTPWGQGYWKAFTRLAWRMN